MGGPKAGDRPDWDRHGRTYAPSHISLEAREGRIMKPVPSSVMPGHTFGIWERFRSHFVGIYRQKNDTFIKN